MNANITVLGTSNSGKTNFIEELIKDINSFSPKMSIMPIVSEQNYDTEIFCNNQYILKVSENLQWIFSICDYDGKLLKSQANDNVDLIDSIYSSDTWIVLVDSTHFGLGEESDEKIIGKIKRNTVRVLMTYISEYAEEHDETLPELMFVVTKAGRIIGQFESDRVKYIIMNAFEGIFTEESSPMILLCETSYTKAAGLAILSLFYIRYAKEVSDGIFQLEKRNEQIENDIFYLQRQICGIVNQKILGKLPANKRKVESFNRQIISLDTELTDNRIRLEQYKSDQGLRHLGICVQRWIDINRNLIINGFDRINYEYDKTMVERVKSHLWIKFILGFDLCILCAMWILAKLSLLPEINGWLLVIGYVVWFRLSVGMAKKFDQRRTDYFGYRFENDLVDFFDTKAKEKK